MRGRYIYMFISVILVGLMLEWPLCSYANQQYFKAEDKKFILEQVKKNLLKALGLKEEPKRQPEAVVSLKMLEEYKSLREVARGSIPDDRDYYGKIDPSVFDKRHSDYYKSGIVVNMNEDVEKGFLFKGETKWITQVTLESDPEDVPEKFQHILPPAVKPPKQQRQFISVHMKFNLSQDLNSIVAEEIKGAELHLTRERLIDCELNECDKQPVPFSNSLKQQAAVKETTDVNNEPVVIQQRYQRVYLLQVLGYDKHNEPMTRVHDSMKVDAQKSTVLRFDIRDIVRQWVLQPTSNYGIIVRVTNDDDEFDQLEQKINSVPRNSSAEETNASLKSKDIQVQISPNVKDHIRLKRQFRSTSESTETWIKHSPKLFVFSSPSSANKFHVKREHSQYEETEMQSDQPGGEDNQNDQTTTTNNPPVQYEPTIAEDSQQQFTSDSNVQVPSRSSQDFQHPTAYSVPNKQSAGPYRYQTNSTNQRRNYLHGNQRNPAGARASAAASHKARQSSMKTQKKVEKCGKRTLTINFDEVGWSSWIIAPHAYQTHYCLGDCSYPLSDPHEASNHAIIQSIFHSARHNSVPRPCCVPTKLGNIAILYQLDGVVQMRTYDDMTVESCGCQ